jgi:hypothetical protein
MVARGGVLTAYECTHSLERWHGAGTDTGWAYVWRDEAQTSVPGLGGAFPVCLDLRGALDDVAAPESCEPNGQE